MNRWMAAIVTTAFCAGAIPAADVVVDLDGLKSKAPAAWKEQKSTSSMRKAQFKIDRAEGDSEDAEVIVFYFGKGQGGGVEENLKRWKGQFKAPAGDQAKTEKFKVGDVQVTYLDIQGVFLSKNPPFDPNAKTIEKPNFRALNAVFASANGPYFIRLAGPDKTVSAQKKAFDDWLKNFK
ncbi:MAG: hypothetical protein K1X57_15200 [Gemmataceae bacterium]|nr:hypothetical protein [Gemmataceae bacterium]